MKSPITGEEMSIQKEWRTMNFRKNEFRVLIHSFKCEKTGEQFEDDTFAQLNYIQLVNMYREKYFIPFTEQILAIRKKYGLSASKMSEILGFGTNSFRQYETGEVPNQSNARLIQLADEPKEFKKLVDLGSTLDENMKSKIYRRIEVLIEEQRNHKFKNQIAQYLTGTCQPNSYTGYRMSSLSRLTEMIVFFVERLQPWKTKLNKLLFYADFSMYKQSGYSISGVKYRAIPMGPVLNNFNSVFEFLVNNSDVDVYCTSFENGGTGEQFKPNPERPFNPDLFTEDELRVLETISNRFKDISTSEIINISHKEKAWIANIEEKKTIDYKYGFYLI